MLVVITLILGALIGVIFSVSLAVKSSSTKQVSPDLSSKASKVYTKAEVALHKSRTDCWIIINNKVYDVTPYVEEHPGGDAILTHAGDDSTEGFYGPQHATRVFDMIDEFYIGDLKE